jgi:hypothetical protein
MSVSNLFPQNSMQQGYSELCLAIFGAGAACFRFKQAPKEEFMRLRINGQELSDERKQRMMACDSHGDGNFPFSQGFYVFIIL